MNSNNFFKDGKNDIGWIGSNFQEHFGDMEFTIPKKLDLKSKKLERWMTGQEILDEFKPKESTLGELAYAIQNEIGQKIGIWITLTLLKL